MCLKWYVWPVTDGDPDVTVIYMALIALTCVFHPGPSHDFADLCSPKAQSKVHALDHVEELLSEGFMNCKLFPSALGKQPLHFQTALSRAEVEEKKMWI